MILEGALVQELDPDPDGLLAIGCLATQADVVTKPAGGARTDHPLQEGCSWLEPLEFRTYTILILGSDHGISGGSYMPPAPPQISTSKNTAPSGHGDIYSLPSPSTGALRLCAKLKKTHYEEDRTCQERGPDHSDLGQHSVLNGDFIAGLQHHVQLQNGWHECLGFWGDVICSPLLCMLSLLSGQFMKQNGRSFASTFCPCPPLPSSALFWIHTCIHVTSALRQMSNTSTVALD